MVIVRNFTKTQIPPHYVEEKKKIPQIFDNKEAAYKCAEDHAEQYEYISDVNFDRIDIKTIKVKSEYNRDNSN